MDLTYVFGPWRLQPAQRVLTSGGQPVRLGGRALDMLVVLVERRQRVVSKDELLELVWPGLVVEENNLQVQVMALRKLLGHPAITTVPGRGYQFTLPLAVEGVEAAAPAAPMLPQAVTGNELIGRDDDLRALLDLLAPSAAPGPGAGSAAAPGRGHRLVTIAGAGGIGKTCLARVLAQKWRTGTGAPVHWIELAPIADPALIVTALAQAIGQTVDGAADPLHSVADSLAARPALVVLDNAEHLIDGVGALLAKLRIRCPQVQWLVTSQEVLRDADEQVYRLPPLALPAPGEPIAHAASYGGVALFLERSRAAGARLRLDAGTLQAAADICRRLDGLPLAIELAAARVPLLGITGVRQRLDDRFDLLTAGSRVALRRHQTLRAALEWSYGLLGTDEQAVFRRLGTFVGGFVLEAAQAAIESDNLDRWDLLDHLGSLVDKSLVLVGAGEVPRYHLLETTRLFALERLADAGETPAQLRAHAQALAFVFAQRHHGTQRWRIGGEAFAVDAAEVDNVRTALDWAVAQADWCLAVQVAAQTGLAFIRGDRCNEYIQRIWPLVPHLGQVADAGLVGLFWLRAAFAGTKSAGHEAALAASQAVAAMRRQERPELLYEALACAVLIGSQRNEATNLAPLVHEAQALEQPQWPPALRAFLRWSLYRWHQRMGQHELALRCALEEAELATRRDRLFALRLSGTHVVDALVALERHEQAEQHARATLATLAEAGITDQRVGTIYEGLSLALVMQGRDDEADKAAIEAWRRLAADNDELRLLEPLAWIVARRGQLADAARIIGYVDAAHRASGIDRWPARQKRRDRLAQLLAQALPEPDRQRAERAGAALSRADVAHLALLRGADSDAAAP